MFYQPILKSKTYLPSVGFNVVDVKLSGVLVGKDTAANFSPSKR